MSPKEGRYAASQRDPMMEQNPMADGDSDYDPHGVTHGVNGTGNKNPVPPLSGIDDSSLGKTTQLTKAAAK